MAEFDSIDRALGEAPETYLTQLDIPQIPTRKSVRLLLWQPRHCQQYLRTVPGLGSSTRTTLDDMVKEAVASAKKHPTATQRR
ncbi:hypothetical protein I553_2311 [Mycobacterium xenopi 4042]|uniref:Uncharacterized protein n=1 Tax=Mycobacterium xenopi 4042 TaxID=1299334 RepID=X8ALE5_MYCXE|nr:hypothetical protein I553_2311 [Mycobacterium xenopi 4042]